MTVEEALLIAARMSVAERATVIAACRTERAAGHRTAAVRAAVAAAFALDPRVVGACGSVWTCPSCGRTSYRVRRRGIVYITGDAAEPCCLRRERTAAA